MNQLIFNYFFSFAHKSLFQDQIFIFLSSGFDILLVFLGIVYIFFHKEGRFISIKNFNFFSVRLREITIFCLTGIVSFLVVILLKDLFNHPRPYESIGIMPLFSYGGMDSFPSGHAAVFGSLSFAILFLHRSFFSWLFFIFSIISLLARIVSGIHFPVDIFVGFLIGFAISFFVYVISRPVIDKKSISLPKS